MPKLDPLPEPRTLTAVKDEVIRRWGTMDLLDVLKDADFLTEFTSEFTSVASRENLDRDTLRRRLLLLVLFALGTNIGIRKARGHWRARGNRTRAAARASALHHPRQPPRGGGQG